MLARDGGLDNSVLCTIIHHQYDDIALGELGNSQSISVCMNKTTTTMSLVYCVDQHKELYMDD